MDSILIAYRNYADIGSLSGGSWASGLPIENLRSKQITQTARTTDTAAASSVIVLDLLESGPISFVGLLRHNLTQSGQWRIVLSSDPEGAEVLLDTGFRAIWPSIFPFGVGLWGEFNWGGRLAAGESASYGIGSYHVLDAPVRARTARIELLDEGNPDGYIEAGRLVVAPAWRPSINIQYGWSIEQVDESRRVSSRGGQIYVDQRPRFRRLRFTLSDLDQNEMLGNAYELERIKGKGGEVLVMLDPSNQEHLHRQTIYGVLAESTAISNPTAGRYEKDFVLEELI